jgi:HME family heavy-metal exporter
LRSKAEEIKAAMVQVEGVKDPLVEPQVVIPQLRVEVDRDKLLTYGLTPDDVSEYVETAMNGEVVSEVLLGQRTFDLLVRFDEPFRENLHALRRLSVELPGGGTAPLSSVAKVYESGGPNTINREQVRRRIIIQANVADRGLVDVVEDIQQRLKNVELPPGYFLEYSGQFESQQSASRMIAVLFGVSLLGVFLVLYTMFGSVNFSLQVMAALPMAFIGSVAALVITQQTLTVAAMVGFISLGGIASRNGILLLNHYLHLVRYEGEGWTREMITRAGQERLAPVLMTALTSGIGLLPLALAAGEAGKEVLYPVATVVMGGLISSTLLEFFVRPALFWTVGLGAGERLIRETQGEVALVEEDFHEHAQKVHDDVKIPRSSASDENKSNENDS